MEGKTQETAAAKSLDEIAIQRASGRVDQLS